MANITSYITATRRLLHDATAQFYTDAELTDYINDARLRVVRDTGCLRQLVNTTTFGQFTITASSAGTTLTVTATAGVIAVGQVLTTASGLIPNTSIVAQLTGSAGSTGTYQITFPQTWGSQTVTVSPLLTLLPGEEQYPYAAFIPNGANCIDILTINVQWGNTKISLPYLPWGRFNEQVRGYTALQGRPMVFSVYGQNTFYLGPPPDQAYPIEIDAVFAPPILSISTDVETIPLPFNSPVPYYAAFTAKQRMQQWDEARWFEKMYKSQINSANQSTFTRRLSRGL